MDTNFLLGLTVGWAMGILCLTLFLKSIEYGDERKRRR